MVVGVVTMQFLTPLLILLLAASFLQVRLRGLQFYANICLTFIMVLVVASAERCDIE